MTRDTPPWTIHHPLAAGRARRSASTARTAAKAADEAVRSEATSAAKWDPNRLRWAVNQGKSLEQAKRSHLLEQEGKRWDHVGIAIGGVSAARTCPAQDRTRPPALDYTGRLADASTQQFQSRTVTRRAPPATIHYPLAAAAVRRLEGRRMPGDLTVQETLQLDDTDPDDSRLYAVMVTCGWAALAIGCTVAMGAAFPTRQVLGDQAGDLVTTVCLGAGFFCLAGCANAIWRMLWYVPQARRRLRDQGAGSRAFKKSMRRILPRNTSLIFQTAVAILVLALVL